MEFEFLPPDVRYRVLHKDRRGEPEVTIGELMILRSLYSLSDTAKFILIGASSSADVKQLSRKLSQLLNVIKKIIPRFQCDRITLESMTNYLNHSCLIRPLPELIKKNSRSISSSSSSSTITS